jgi:glycosyltransferase involved in cell wall biosynthesis
MIKAFLASGYNVVYISDARIDTLPAAVIQEAVPPLGLFDFFDEFQLLAYNLQLLNRSRAWMRKYRPCLVYQRHGILNMAGGLIAHHAEIPCVLEANASEVWVKKHWSRLLFEDLSQRYESLAMSLADKVAVISQGVQEQLAGYHIPHEKFVLNPNGVDPQEFHPGVDGSNVRKLYGLERNIIVGFIGTFTKWHGVEVLVDAALETVRKNEKVAFLLIGDGELRSALENRVRADGLESRIKFTGLVLHSEAPAYLAACDILVSPHLGFDGSEKFFGSPTKLFEYMAMGKAIVASDLEQIGEVIEDGMTGLHCKPGDSKDLAEKVLLLTTNEILRKEIGLNARAAAEQDFSWNGNVERIMRSLSVTQHFNDSQTMNRGSHND